MAPTPNLYIMVWLILHNFVIRNLGADFVSTTSQRHDILRLPADCLNFWQLESVIFISDREFSIDVSADSVQDFPFQQLTSFQELKTQLEYGEKKLLVFSLMPIHERDFMLLSTLLLGGITVLVPQPSNPQALENMNLRLDSRQEEYSKHPPIIGL